MKREEIARIAALEAASILEKAVAEGVSWSEYGISRRREQEKLDTELQKLVSELDKRGGLRK